MLNGVEHEQSFITPGQDLFHAIFKNVTLRRGKNRILLLL